MAGQHQRRRRYTPISGATSTTLTFTTSAVQTGNQYEAVFTNSAGSAIATPLP